MWVPVSLSTDQRKWAQAGADFQLKNLGKSARKRLSARRLFPAVLMASVSVMRDSRARLISSARLKVSWIQLWRTTRKEPSAIIHYFPAYTCPSGEPLKRNGAVVSCQRALDTVAVTQRSVVRRDAQLSCPTDHFCFLYDKSGAVGSGHCCPVPTNVCPAGKPDKSATCGNLKSSSRTCDLTTHQCLPVKVDGEKVAELCCLRPCAEGLVFWNQKCLEPVAVGDDCEADEQCASGTGVCRKGEDDSVFN